MDTIKRRTTRLAAYDYSRNGIYFVTICTHQRHCCFGDIVDDEIMLSDIGRVVEQCWLEIHRHFKSVSLDEYVIMPNHIHGLLILDSCVVVEARHVSPVLRLGTIIGQFKSAASKQVQTLEVSAGPLWQRGYYDHVVRSQESLHRIQEYIVNNPAQWMFDTDNIDRSQD